MTPKKQSSPRKSTKGKPKQILTFEKKLEVAEKICAEYARDEHTIESICGAYGVPYQTFYQWATDGQPGHIEEIENLLKAAKDAKLKTYMARLSKKAKTALEKLVDGFESEEKTQEIDLVVRDDGKVIQVPKKAKVVKKQIAPNVTAAIFALKNTDPATFKDRHEHDLGADTLGSLFDYLRKKGSDSEQGDS